MPLRLHWDDVHTYLVAMRARSLREVADELGISHPTAGRRVTAMEERLRLRLFHRRPDGLHPTPERQSQALDPELRGPIRVTLPQNLATDLLMPDLVTFATRWPEIELHVETTSRISDLAQREADVAIRILPVGQSPSEELAGRKAATAYRAIYGTGEAWIGWRTRPSSLDGHEAAFADLPVRGFMEDISLQRAACMAGLGLARLPCFSADPYLPRRSEPEPGGDIWVLVHPDLRRNPRLRLFRDHVVDALKGHAARLEGRS
jgi:DNA-binding transcriptional LysR family regulator